MDKRTTSSGKEPLRDIPLPERLRDRRPAPQPQEQEPADKRWNAQLDRVQQCTGTNLINGLDATTNWQHDLAEKTVRVYLECEGDHTGWRISLFKILKNRDPQPTELLRVNIPSEEDQVDIRSLESTRCLELRLRGKMTVEDERVRLLALRTEGAAMLTAKSSLKRLQFVTGNMPQEWLAYRNFAARPKANSPASAVFEHQVTGGYKYTFTGFVASEKFQREIGNLTPEQTTGAMVTRARIEEVGGELLELTGKNVNVQTVGKKQRKAENKAKQSQRRAAKRVAKPASPSLTHLVSPSLPQPFSPIDVDADDTNRAGDEVSQASNASSDVDSTDWEVEKILDVRFKDGKTEYHIRWAGEWPDEWVKANSVSPGAGLEDFWRDRAIQSAAESSQ